MTVTAAQEASRGSAHSPFSTGQSLFGISSGTRFNRSTQQPAKIRHLGARCFSPLWWASTLGYSEQVVVMHGGSSIASREVLCRCNGDEVCVFRLRWS